MNIQSQSQRPANIPNGQGPTPPRTPLQKHVDFFDRNHDGETTVAETYAGLRALGLGRALSGAGALFINAGLAHKTGAPWYSLTIQNDNIAAAKHDSDSDVYDAQGNYDAAKFEEMFAKNDLDKDGALNKAEVDGLLARNKETAAGGVASKAEFGLLFRLAAQPNADGEKVLTRERMSQLYDGSLFYELEKAQQG